jgi:hypothetical protein
MCTRERTPAIKTITMQHWTVASNKDNQEDKLQNTGNHKDKDEDEDGGGRWRTVDVGVGFVRSKGNGLLKERMGSRKV